MSSLSVIPAKAGIQGLQARWLGRVSYPEADTLQRALHQRTDQDYLLLVEHPHTYTLGTRAKQEHVLVDPHTVNADLFETDRGGDVTYHGPGQLVAYPIISLPEWRGGQRDVVAYLRSLEAVLVAVLREFGIGASTVPELTGVWVGDKKIAAIGVKVAQGRTRHGFALNVNPDLTMFDHIVPCGIYDKGVTSLAELGVDVRVPDVLDTVTRCFAEYFEHTSVDIQKISMSGGTPIQALGSGPAVHAEPVRLLGRLAQAGVQADPALSSERPEWMRVRATQGEKYQETKEVMHSLDLHTVCEDAGCPNIYECWSNKTATFMILGERCTRACGFCLVDTRKPLEVDADEPARVADAVAKMGLEHAVITCVARDDLEDDGASIFAATVAEIRKCTPQTQVELLISDCRGRASSLDVIFNARPDVLNHNLETVARLQRAARPSAGYARSLGVLTRAKNAGLVTKSGIILGMGETVEEVRAALQDLRNVGVDIVTIGQYLRPTSEHLPVAKWWHPDEFAELKEFALSLGFAHCESGPLVRSSYHAKEATQAAIV